MTLDESTDGLERLDASGIIAYIDPNLKSHLDKLGDIKVDFITDSEGQSGYTITIGVSNCDTGGCSCEQ